MTPQELLKELEHITDFAVFCKKLPTKAGFERVETLLRNIRHKVAAEGIIINHNEQKVGQKEAADNEHKRHIPAIR